MNWSYTIPDGEHAGVTLWSNRYCGITAIVLLEKDDEVFILANKRGKGCEDLPAIWNLPSGFLDEEENGKQGASRETYEECGVLIPPELFDIYEVVTEPERCHKGHVTIRYGVLIDDSNRNLIDFSKFDEIGTTGGEKDEVEKRKWIPIEEYKNYQWAFGHDKLIEELLIHMGADIQ